MTVGELKEALKDVPNDLTVFAEGEQADKVLIEECFGNRYVRIFPCEAKQTEQTPNKPLRSDNQPNPIPSLRSTELAI